MKYVYTFTSSTSVDTLLSMDKAVPFHHTFNFAGS